MESTVQIGQLPKRVGQDGKARKRPRSRAERREVRLDRERERHIEAARENLELGDKYAEEAEREYAMAATLSSAAAAPDSNPLITAWDKATRAQRHEFIVARKLDVMRAQQQIGPLAHEPTSPVDDIPGFLDRTGGRR